MSAPTVSAVTGLPDVVGRYKIQRLLGRGSFAVVALAWDEELESAVALKILHTRNCDTENQFLQEARMLRRIQSLNVISVHDIGRLPCGSPYFVLDYASRGTLAERLGAESATSFYAAEDPVQLLNFVDGLADGLTAIHRASMVHRDIKPANILFCSGLNQVNKCSDLNLHEPANTHSKSAHRYLLADGERLLVSDLGIAKDLSNSVEHSTLIGGTPFYLAPEQRMPDQPITAAADIYSATAVLWRILTNSSPPSSTQVAEQLTTHTHTCLESDWLGFFEKGMSLAAQNRFQNADEWRWAVHDVVGTGSSTVTYKPGTKTSIEPQTDVCPYKGLAAYEESDSRFFRGRDELVNQLARRLQLESVLVVAGPSGSGKSSLVRAGLVPSLKHGALPGSEHWQCLLMTPGPEPLQALQDCLKTMGGINAVVNGDNETEETTLLVVDQFEEIFTLANEAERDEFLRYLSDLSKKGNTEFKLTLAVRADFYSECAKVPWLAASITTNQVLVGPMSSTELRQAITEPAKEAGYRLEEGLVSSILEDAGNGCGSLPLVAHALVETWVRRTDRTLTLNGFKACGGVAGAISQSADATYDHQLDDQGRIATRGLMLNLVNPGDGSPDTRRVVDREDIFYQTDSIGDASVLADVIKKLTTARLLTVDDRKVQIAHETLLSNWPRLRNWIDESRDDLRMRRRICLRAEEWEAEGQESDLLYQGTPLITALDWREANPAQLGSLENLFLDCAKHRHTDAEEKAAKGRQRNRRILHTGIALLTLLTLGATLSTVVAYKAYKDSQNNAQLAEQATATANFRFASALGAAAYGHYAEDPRLSLVIASEAMARSSSLNPPRAPAFDTRAAMLSARQVLAKGGPFLWGSPIVAGNALSIALNPIGTILAIGNKDGEVQFLDVASHQEIQPGIKDHAGGVRDLEFSPDGKSMVSVGVDGKVLLWRSKSNGIWSSKRIGQSADVIPDVDFHPSGDYVVSANHDATVRVWYTDDRNEQPAPLASGVADVNALAISSDGKFIVAGNADKTISGWNINTGEVVMGPLKKVHASHLLDIQFSPSGTSFFTMTTDGETKKLSFPEGKIISTVFENKETIGATLINSVSGELIGGNNDGQLLCWDIESGGINQRSAAGHSQIIIKATMTQDERMIATLGRDQLIRFWTNNDNYPIAELLQDNTRASKSIAISPDGTMVASGDEKGQIKLRRLDSNNSQETLTQHAAQVWALAFSPDGELLASADRDGQVKVWDVKKQRVVQVIDTGAHPVWSVAFIEQGALLVATESGVLKYSTQNSSKLSSWSNTDAKITRLTTSPDKSKVIVTYNNGLVEIVNARGEPDKQTIRIGEDLLWSAAFNHAGDLLAAASSDETVSLIDIKSGQRVAKLTGHQGGATNVAFMDDGTTLVASDRRGSIHWWDIATGRRLAAPWRGHRKAIWRLAMHPDGERFITAADDGKVRLWDTQSMKRACEIGFPSFDRGQKNRYLGRDHIMLACQ